MILRRIPALFVFAALLGQVRAAPYTDLVPHYNRLTSNVMARKIVVPTAANLDYAAYTANPVLNVAETPIYKRPAVKVPIDSITFGGKICDIKDRIDETPLTSLEIQQPLAWRPLVKKLWSVVKERSFPAAGSAINGFKWADPSVYQPYQEVSSAYVHGSGDSAQLWLKIEFSPWVDFLKNVDDEDNDGIKEIYGRLSPGVIPPDSLKKAIAWIRGEYSPKVLDRQEIIDWITDLASYWYPTKNTDLVDMGESTVWPNAGTEKSVVKTMAGVVIKNPVAVVKGKPFDPAKPIYNVYVVESADTAQGPKQAVDAPQNKAAVAGAIDTSVSKNFRENDARFAREIRENGDYPAWAKPNAAFDNGLKTYLSSIPSQQMAFAGKDHWLFFRKSADYLLSGDLNRQPDSLNPLPHILAFKEYLREHGVNMLFVPVPCKEEIYPEKLPQAVPAAGNTVVNPYGRKFLGDLQAMGVEVVDLLPLFLSEKKQDASSREPLFQPHDTHWTDRGLELTADAIAARIRQYAWYASMPKTAFSVIDTNFPRQGDLVDKLPESDRAAYTAVRLSARQVRLPDGRPYIGSPASPIMLIGDSFTGVFESVDCKSAGVGAHVAEKSGLSVEIVTSWGGGPLVRKKAMASREKNLGAKRLVIYLMTARDLYHYSMGWETFPEKGKQE